MNDPIPFEEDPDPADRLSRGEQLVLDLDGYEGPIDVLLTLARDQKVDITKIAILDLAEQYLAFIRAAQDYEIELAADYLVMAAWLAYLKSRLLLPKDEDDTEPSGQELADALKFQLRRLESMQKSGKELLKRKTLGQDFFGRGAPEGLRIATHTIFDVSLSDLLRAFGRATTKAEAGEVMEIEPYDLHSIDEALQRLKRLLGHVPEWTDLSTFLPDRKTTPLLHNSAVATTLIAALELVRDGHAAIRQDKAFSPILVKQATRAPDDQNMTEGQ